MEKTYISTQKYVRMAPRKVRLVADSIRKLTPQAAIDVLPFSARSAAAPLLKVVKTAVANAKLAGVEVENLIFDEVEISEGPALKRGIAVSRGQWHPIKKRMSHIRVVVKEKAVKPVKAEKKVEPKVEEPKKVAKVKKEKTK